MVLDGKVIIVTGSGRGVGQIFKEQQGGAMVHMTSTSRLIGNLDQANYSTAKMRLLDLSKSTALDIRSMPIGDVGGITTVAVIDRVIPSFRSSLYPLERSMNVFNWDPI